MNGKLVGVRSLVAFITSLATLVVCAWFLADQFTAVSVSVISLFSMLLGRKKTESQANGNGGA